MIGSSKTHQWMPNLKRKFDANQDICITLQGLPTKYLLLAKGRNNYIVQISDNTE